LGLPLTRDHDHAIPLIEGAVAIKIRPYRYPHHHKAQIELMVKQMLEEGIIQPSNNPFSSHILLVKKKDGTWRFCTDYRSLNKITIKDNFPFRQLMMELGCFQNCIYDLAIIRSLCAQKIGTKQRSEHMKAIMNGL